MIRLMVCLMMLSSLLIGQDERLERRASAAENQQTSTVKDAIRADQAARATERAEFRTWFAEAYRAYPQLPEGVLEAIAFTASRWEHLQAHTPDTSHHHMPQAHGLMGFYNGQGGFVDTLSQAADALGVDVEKVRDDPRSNILAGAALLQRYVDELGLDAVSYEGLVPALHLFSGLPQAQSKTGRYALDSHAFDVLLALDRGHDDAGIVFSSKAIDFSKAFAPETLQTLNAPFIRMDPANDILHIPGYRLDNTNQVIEEDPEDSEPRAASKAAVDYPGAIWVTSPNFSTRSLSISAVTIHTTQGSYAGAISWFQNVDSQVSAHYVLRSSDGQITQMVQEVKKAWHVGSENSYTVGIEHEGWVSNSSWYTAAMYNSSSALTEDICDDNGIDPTTAYSGAAHSGVTLLSSTYKIKGHQHYPNSSHTDPGIYWDWADYYDLVNGGTPPPPGSTTVLDDFEASEGHFINSPTYSGSTYGISTSSTASRTSSIAKTGSYSEQIKLVDNSSSSSSWNVRFLSGSGSTGNNTSLATSGGKLGFWVYTGGSGITAALGMDDSDGTERSISRSITADTWTFLEWELDDSAQWNAWVGGNGALTASTVSLDAIWFYHANTSFTIYVYIDDVTYTQ